MPGHGPLANASDLLRYADYLEALQAGAAAAHAAGWSEEEAAEHNDLARWHLSILPSYHHGHLIWSTASNNGSLGVSTVQPIHRNREVRQMSNTNPEQPHRGSTRH